LIIFAYATLLLMRRFFAAPDAADAMLMPLPLYA